MIHWDKVMEQLQKEIPFDYYQRYVEPLKLERETEKKVFIQAPSKTIIEQIQKRFLQHVQNALQVTTGKKFILEFNLSGIKIDNTRKTSRRNPTPINNVNPHSFLIKLRDHLRENYDFKKNLITGAREYKKKHEKEFKPLNVDSDDFNDVYFEIKTSHGFHDTSQDSLHRIIFSNQVTTSFHPIKQYYTQVENLYNPKRDGDVIQKWLNCLQVSNKHINTSYLKKHLLRGLHTVFTDGEFENEDIFIIHGIESSFKTSFIKTLISKMIKDYFIKGIPKDLKGDKDYYLRVGRVYYWNLDDLTKLSEKDRNFIKAFLNTGDDVERGAYGELDTRIKRLTTFFGTSNTKKILHNTKEGNRRNKILTVSQKIDINTAQRIDIDKFHSQLYYDYKKQVTINHRFIDWTKEEFDANTVNNHNYESINEMENAILQNFNPIKESEYNKNNPLHLSLSASQIEKFLLNVNSDYKFNSVWIARQLTDLNFAFKRSSHKSKAYLLELKNKSLLEFLK